MKKLISLTAICIFTVSGFAQMRQFGKTIKNVNRIMTTGILTSEALKAAKNAQNARQKPITKVRPKVANPTLPTLTFNNQFRHDSLFKAPHIEIPSLPKLSLPDPKNLRLREDSIKESDTGIDRNSENIKEFYRFSYDNLVENPTDDNLAFWVIETSERPIETASMLFKDIMQRYFPNSSVLSTFEWSDMSDFNSEELEILSSMAHIGLTAIEEDDGKSEDITKDFLIYNIALWMTVDPTEIENAERDIDYLNEKTATESDKRYDNLRALLIYAKAYIAGHGMDNPQKAYNLLKKAEKSIEKMDLEPDVKIMYWQYLRALGEATGDQNEVNRCDSIIDNIQNEIDAASSQPKS